MAAQPAYNLLSRKSLSGASAFGGFASVATFQLIRRLEHDSQEYPNFHGAVCRCAALPAAVDCAGLAQDNVSLTLSIGARGFGDAAPILIETCEQEVGGISVEWERISDVPNESRSIYVTNFTACNSKPDIIAVDVIWPGDFAARGWIAPIEDYFSANELAEYIPGFLAAAQVDSHTYAIPLYIDGIHLFYRADLLEKYGFDAPTTWEALIMQAQTIVEGENNPDLAGFVSMWAKIEGLFMIGWLSSRALAAASLTPTGSWPSMARRASSRCRPWWACWRAASPRRAC